MKQLTMKEKMQRAWKEFYLISKGISELNNLMGNFDTVPSLPKKMRFAFGGTLEDEIKSNQETLMSLYYFITDAYFNSETLLNRAIEEKWASQEMIDLSLQNGRMINHFHLDKCFYDYLDAPTMEKVRTGEINIYNTIFRKAIA